MTEWYSIVYVHHVFIHSSVDGHLCCLYALAIVNRAVVSTGVHASVRIMVFSGCMPRSGITGLDGDSIVILFSIMAAPVYIPTNSVGGKP